MSLRQKAREVKEAGMAERSNFAPHGVPKNIYQWWLKESTSKRARAIKYGERRENFCHFWRVVLFWAPLRKVAYTADKYLFNRVVGFSILALWALAILTVAVLNPLSALVVVALACGIVLQGTGIFAGASAALTPEQRRRKDLIQHRGAIATFFVLGLPLALPTYLITRFARFYYDNLTAYNKSAALSVAAVLLVAGTFVLGTAASWTAVLFAASAVATGAVVVVLAFFVIGHVADYVSGRRALAVQKREDRMAVYLAENGTLPTRKPSAFEAWAGRFFSGVGDFIVLVAQVVRVKKWGICPLVELDDERTTA